jgi:plastocyanin
VGDLPRSPCRRIRRRAQSTKENHVPRKRAIVGAMLAASMATAAIGAGVAFAAAAGSKSNPIKAQTSASNGFGPKSVTVKPGVTVYWTNKDHAPHNAVASKKVNGKAAFTSGSPKTGNFSAKAPSKAGTYAYICQVHPFMKGTLVVKAS